MLVAGDSGVVPLVTMLTLEYGRRVGTTGYRTQLLDRVVDTVHFVNSAPCPMVQLADVVTYVKRRAAAPRHPDVGPRRRWTGWSH